MIMDAYTIYMQIVIGAALVFIVVAHWVEGRQDRNFLRDLTAAAERERRL